MDKYLFYLRNGQPVLVKPEMEMPMLWDNYCLRIVIPDHSFNECLQFGIHLDTLPSIEVSSELAKGWDNFSWKMENVDFEFQHEKNYEYFDTIQCGTRTTAIPINSSEGKVAAKHRDYLDMIENSSTVTAEDISQFALFSKGMDGDKALKITELIIAYSDSLNHEGKVEDLGAEQEAKEYADKAFPYVWPKNGLGEEIVQRVGQKPPNSKKHSIIHKKIIAAYIAGKNSKS